SRDSTGAKADPEPSNETLCSRKSCRTCSSHAAASPSFDPKWWTTSWADTPAASATDLIVARATPCAANSESAASRIRETAVRSRPIRRCGSTPPPSCPSAGSIPPRHLSCFMRLSGLYCVHPESAISVGLLSPMLSTLRALNLTHLRINNQRSSLYLHFLLYT